MVNNAAGGGQQHSWQWSTIQPAVHGSVKGAHPVAHCKLRTSPHLGQVVGQQLQRLVPVRGAVHAPQRAEAQCLREGWGK